jgi:hypothetical protein
MHKLPGSRGGGPTFDCKGIDHAHRLNLNLLLIATLLKCKRTKVGNWDTRQLSVSEIGFAGQSGLVSTLFK